MTFPGEGEAGTKEEVDLGEMGGGFRFADSEKAGGEIGGGFYFAEGHEAFGGDFWEDPADFWESLEKGKEVWFIWGSGEAGDGEARAKGELGSDLFGLSYFFCEGEFGEAVAHSLADRFLVACLR